MSKGRMYVGVVAALLCAMMFVACSSGGSSGNANGNVPLTGTVQIKGVSNQNK